MNDFYQPEICRTFALEFIIHLKNSKTMTKRTRTVWVKNEHHIKVRKCCASCQYKEIQNDGTRVCTLMQLIMGQRDKCKNWQMSDALRNAGLQNGGVVKLKGTLEVVIS